MFHTVDVLCQRCSHKIGFRRAIYLNNYNSVERWINNLFCSNPQFLAIMLSRCNNRIQLSVVECSITVYWHYSCSISPRKMVKQKTISRRLFVEMNYANEIERDRSKAMQVLGKRTEQIIRRRSRFPIRPARPFCPVPCAVPRFYNTHGGGQ